MNIYCCRKCSTTVQKDATPNGGKCPDGGSHTWSNLGKAGTKNNYQCKKCSTLVQADSTPNGGTCAGGGSHSWSRL